MSCCHIYGEIRKMDGEKLMFLFKQLNPGYINLLSVVSKTLRTISHIAMLSNQTVCLALRTINQITALNKPVYKTFKKTDTVSVIFSISLLSHFRLPFLSTLCSTDVVSKRTHIQYTPNTQPTNSNNPHPPSLYRLSLTRVERRVLVALVSLCASSFFHTNSPNKS